MKVTYIIIIIIIITALIITVIIINAVNQLKKWHYEQKIQNLELELSCLRSQLSSAHNISQDEIDAVKYAIKHAHPDNGGNEEDFIKFKKCYEELTRK